MNKKPLLLTYSLVFMVTALWGMNVVIIKILVDDLPPQTMTAFRIMLAGATALAVVILGKSFRPLTKKEWIYILLGMLFGVVLHQSLIAFGLTMVDASIASLILALVPLTTAILAVLFLGEKFTLLRAIGFMLALTGVFFIQGGSIHHLGFSTGEIILFLAMFVQAASFILIRKVTVTVDSKQVTALMSFFGSISLLIISFIVEPQGLSQMTSAPPFTYFLFFFSGIVISGGGHLIFNASIQKIGAAQTAVFNNFVPFFGLVSSAVFLNETITISQSVGFVFIVTGVLFGTGYIEKQRELRIRKKEAQKKLPYCENGIHTS